MDQKIILLTIAAMALVTWVSRVLPLVALSNRGMPEIFSRWMSHVPVAVLSAMLLPSILSPKGTVHMAWDNYELWVALPTFWVAWKTRSLFGTVLCGMVLLALCRLL